MGSYSSVFGVLKDSIHNNDLIILIAAIFTAFILVITITLSLVVKSNIDEWKREKNRQFSRFIFISLRVSYTLFTTMITVFPLLGMLGTVFGLLGLDLANGDMSNIKANFFIALTSTAWGIIFSIIFKIIHGCLADSVEERIEIVKALSE
ncbi:MAG: MotA/TolQ/ExbB proton channel family protein [Lachnospiraceae bacterium]|nr:MotA/TolQ/ExbB proton channel family protein [Lachnospiraceae bacterium]